MTYVNGCVCVSPGEVPPEEDGFKTLFKEWFA